jgi:NADH-quinone oxidoreductase subunit C
MTPGQVAERVGELLGLPAEDASGSAGVDVPRERWAEAAEAVRDDPALALVLFDVLTAVDQSPDGFEVVLRLWSPVGRHGLLLRTRCPRDDARVPTLTGLFGGADWHERALHEMFGIEVDGHPGLAPLLLPPDLGAHPLRKDFVLASRTVRAWPGAVEPGQSAAEAAAARPSRRRLQAPGVPAPGTWPGERS